MVLPSSEIAIGVVMKKVFHFDTLREPYRCDAAVVACFDRRFNLGLQKFLKRSDIANPDLIVVAGGAKHLASPQRESDREFVLQQIQTSMRLHETKRVILTVHSDCGAYGGLAGRFGGNIEAEARHHEQELRVAAACVQKLAPKMIVQGYLIGFDGIWEVEDLRNS
jgi:carbonic anhydrase